MVPAKFLGTPNCLGQPQILETLYQITEIALISGVGGGGGTAAPRPAPGRSQRGQKPRRVPAKGAPYSRVALRCALSALRVQGGSPDSEGACGWEGLSAPGPAPQVPSPGLSRCGVAQPGAADYISPPPRAGRAALPAGVPGERVGREALPGSAALLRSSSPLCPPRATRLPAAQLPRVRERVAARAEGSKGAERLHFHLRRRSASPRRQRSLRNLSEDGGRNSRGGASHHGGQDLLSRLGGLCGGCDHLPAGHGQSPATGREQDGEGVHLREMQGDLIPALIYLSKGR